MRIKGFVLVLFLVNWFVFFSQKSQIEKQVDSLLTIKSSKPFNGVVFIEMYDSISFSRVKGFSDFSKSKLLTLKNQFVIGSISKQFTAVIVLIEYEKGHINLDIPISTYLPELPMSWKDSITIHQLLTHTHGIVDLNENLEFIPGSKFHYSQLGYHLLAKIIEKTSGKSFATLSKEMFEFCDMENSFHPDEKLHRNLVKSYTEDENGVLILEKNSFQNFPAAGSFVSTVEDLLLWNTCFYGGKILKQETMNLLTAKQAGAVRDHPIFGITEYGYGITITNTNKVLQYGQTGFAPGYVSMNYYFPETKTSVIVLENVSYDSDDLKKTFHVHVELLELIRKQLAEI
jgi:CubicO group peptidase (beta-lactamase class C family)